MNIIHIKMSNKDDGNKFTTLTIEQEGDYCTVSIEHTVTRQILSWGIDSGCNFKFTDPQKVMILHKAMDILAKENKYFGIEVTDEDKEFWYSVIATIHKKIHLSPCDDMKMNVHIDASDDLYRELNYILKNR